MLNCDDIFYINEIKNYEENMKIFEKVLNDFIVLSNIDIKINKCITNSYDKVQVMKYQYVFKNLNTINLFYQVLNKYNYYKKTDIKDAIYKLGALNDPNENKNTIKTILKSLYIDDISFNGKNKFKIYSNKFKTIEFELANYLFRNNTKMKEYIKKNTIVGNCHNNTYALANIMPNLTSITSLCKFYFKGNYYHSYTYNKKENEIIDLCNNSVIKKHDFDRIYSPKEISVLNNYEINDILKQTIQNTNQSMNMCELMKIALYNQFLEQKTKQKVLTLS